MRIFLDANILFAAANPDSLTRLLVDVLLASGIPCLSNAYAVEEARRNIIASRPQHLAGLEALLPSIRIVRRLVAKLEVTLKSKDIPILYGAAAGKASHLLTYDVTDFGELMRRPYRGVKVLTPRMLLEELRAKGII